MGKRIFQGNAIVAFDYLKGPYKNEGEGLFYGHTVAGQGAVVLHLKKVYLD